MRKLMMASSTRPIEILASPMSIPDLAVVRLAEDGGDDRVDHAFDERR